MKAEEFLEVARLLAGGGPFPQGRKRSAISRSYYSAFLEARDLLISRAVFRKPLPAKPKHDLIWKAYMWADDKYADLKEIGRLLQDLKKMRETADYDLPNDASDADVKEADRLAKEIRDKLPAVDVTNCFDPM